MKQIRNICWKVPNTQFSGCCLSVARTIWDADLLFRPVGSALFPNPPLLPPASPLTHPRLKSLSARPCTCKPLHQIWTKLLISIPHICHRHHRRCLCKNILSADFSRMSKNLENNFSLLFLKMQLFWKRHLSKYK